MPFLQNFLQLYSRSEKHLLRGILLDNMNVVLAVHLTQYYKFRSWINFKIFLTHCLRFFHFTNLVQVIKQFDLTNIHFIFKIVWKEANVKMNKE